MFSWVEKDFRARSTFAKVKIAERCLLLKEL